MLIAGVQGRNPVRNGLLEIPFSFLNLIVQPVLLRGKQNQLAVTVINEIGSVAFKQTGMQRTHPNSHVSRA